MSVRDQPLQPIYRGEDATIVLSPEDVTLDLTSATVEFAIGQTLESPTVTRSTGSGITTAAFVVGVGSVITIVISDTLTKTLTEGRNYYSVWETTSGNTLPIAAGIVYVKKSSRTPP